VFNKTVGLRDNWTKNSVPAKPDKLNIVTQDRKAIDIVKQLGKKYTNLPKIKQSKVKAEIKKLSEKITYEEVCPLFGTAAKKVGTRIAVMIILKELLKKGQERNMEIEEFIEKASADKNTLLSQESSI
jgi:glutaminyl-tRNA synthetase